MKASLAEQIRCVERECMMRSRVYAGLVDRKKMSPADADREIATMGAVLETLKQCEQLADCLEKAPVVVDSLGIHDDDEIGLVPPEERRTVTFTEKLVKQIAAQLRGGS